MKNNKVDHPRPITGDTQSFDVNIDSAHGTEPPQTLDSASSIIRNSEIDKTTEIAQQHQTTATAPIAANEESTGQANQTISFPPLPSDPRFDTFSGLPVSIAAMLGRSDADVFTHTERSQSLQPHSAVVTTPNIDAIINGLIGMASSPLFPAHSQSINNAPPQQVNTYAIDMANIQGPALEASPGIILSLDQDELELSPYQCLIRKQIEAFEQPEHNIAETETIQGRNRPIVPGQVGIRCRHCGRCVPALRTKGAVLFPSTLLGVYQTAQNMANTHLIELCRMIPTAIRAELIRIRSKEKGKQTRKSSYGGGRQYWADSLRIIGVVETPDRRLRFLKEQATSK